MTECVLVTGGAGYIGGVVASQLLDRGFEVIVLDNLSHGSCSSVPADAKFVLGDITDRAILNRIFRKHKISAVMHFAAFIEAVRRVTGHPIPATMAGRRPGDPAVLVASSEKIKSELEWRPDYPDLEAIIRSAWEWRRAHPDGYDEDVLRRDRS